jgi:hypothetical protein
LENVGVIDAQKPTSRINPRVDSHSKSSDFARKLRLWKMIWMRGGRPESVVVGQRNWQCRQHFPNTIK